MNSPTTPLRQLWNAQTIVIVVVSLAAVGYFGLERAVAQKGKESSKESSTQHPHSADEHAREVTALRQAFGTAQIDLFFELSEVDTQKPGLAGAKFVDAVDVTGKELLRFERGGDSWLIDPDTVFAYRVHKGK